MKFLKQDILLERPDKLIMLALNFSLPSEVNYAILSLSNKFLFFLVFYHLF